MTLFLRDTYYNTYIHIHYPELTPYIPNKAFSFLSSLFFFALLCGVLHSQMLFTLFSLICFFILLLPLSDPKGFHLLLQLRFSCFWAYYLLRSCLLLSITVVNFMTFSFNLYIFDWYLFLNFSFWLLSWSACSDWIYI